MNVKDIIKLDNNILRVLSINNNNILVIDCVKLNMPYWIDGIDYELMSEEDFKKVNPLYNRFIDDILEKDKAMMHKRFSIISPLLSCVDDEIKRNDTMHRVSELYGISLSTVKRWLCLYLAFQDIVVLAPLSKNENKVLSDEKKTFRKYINRYYYTRQKQKLTTVYNYMIKEAYTDSDGKLVDNYPPFSRFKYFFYQYNKKQTELISRDGHSNYARNNRPLLGCVQDFVPGVGNSMWDSTICDIYLINTAGELVGRPVLTLCVCPYSFLILGYYLGWEGGVYSLDGLLQNVIDEKKEYCNRFGISVDSKDWPCSGGLPGTFITDRGSEYIGDTFEQIVELGVQIVNLQAFRPELKGIVEQSFHQLQELYKPLLKGKGVVEPDALERGVRDYRKDACLTMDDFEKIIIRCIIYYNSKHLIKNYPLTKEMIADGVKPYANELFLYGLRRPEAHFIDIEPERLKLTMLPRTSGRWTRRGLIVKGQRYRNMDGNYTEIYLNGGDAIIAYDEENMGKVWLLDKGKYVPFEIIHKMYDNLSLEELNEISAQKKELAASEERKCLEAKVKLMNDIETITANCQPKEKLSVKNIRENRAKEIKKRRIKNG